MSLPNGLRRWQVLWQSKKREPNLHDNLLLALGACDKDAFPIIYSLLIISCTLPNTSAEAERSFSLMRRIKNYLRSTMREEQISDLSVIAMNYSERIPVDEVCHAFIQANPRCLFKVSKTLLLIIKASLLEDIITHN